MYAPRRQIDETLERLDGKIRRRQATIIKEKETEE